MTTEEALINLLVHSQCLLESIYELEQNKNFKIPEQLAFYTKGIKKHGEKFIKDVWTKIPDGDKHYFTDLVNAKIKLLEAYDNREILIQKE